MVNCDSIAGCRVINATYLPQCAKVVRLVPTTVSLDSLTSLDHAAAQEIAKLPRTLLSGECFNALKAFICMGAIDGCGNGHKLPLCRSACDQVRSACGMVVMMSMPANAKRRMTCSQYPRKSWPQCAQPASAGLQKQCLQPLEQQPMCHAASPKLHEEPCGACDQFGGSFSFRPLLRDRCGVCNGDNSSCTACDGASGSYDACAVCNGAETSCHALDTDPGLLGHLAVATAAVVAALVAAGLLRRLLRRAGWSPAVAPPQHWARKAGGSAPGPAAQHEPGWWHRAGAVATIQAASRRCQVAFFRHLGLAVARRPAQVMAGTALLALAAGCGLLRMEVSKDPLALWLPANSPAAVNQARWQALTEQPRWRVLSVLLVPREGARVPARTGLQQAIAVHQALVELRVQAADGPAGAAVGIIGHCEDSRGEMACGSSSHSVLANQDGLLSPLRLWDHSRSLLDEDPDPWNTLVSSLHDAGADEGFSAAILRGQVSLAGSDPGATPNASVGAESASGLRALHLTYVLDGSSSRQTDVATWERAALERLRSSQQDGWPLWRALGFSEQGLSDELTRSIDGDTLLIVAGYTLMSVYMSFFLGRHRDFVRSRGAMVSVALVSIGLSTLSAFGACAGAGVTYNETVNIAIFVLLGVGVDDAFIVVDALEDILSAAAAEENGSGGREAIERHVGEALGDCGSAIFLSSATNVLAFALSSFTPLPALRSFCIYCSVGMVTDFLYQLTFFVAALTLDERRRLARRCTVVPCVVVSAGTQFSWCSQTSAQAPAWDRQAERVPVLLSWGARAAVLLAYAASLSLSSWSAFTMDVGLQVSDLVPVGSYIQDYFAATSATFPQRKYMVEVLVQHQPRAEGLGVAPLEDADVWRGLRRLREALIATDFIGADAGGVAPLWLDSFAEYLRREALPPMSRLGPSFHGQIASFLNSSVGATLRRSGALLEQNGSVAATRLRLLAGGYGAEAMLAVRASVAAGGLRDAVFAHSAADIYFEQDAIMLRYTYESVLWVTLAVLATVLLVSASVGFVAVMAACVLSCCTHMFGWMALTGTPLNSLSLIPLLLSASLCIDYCTHIVHAFWDAQGGSKDRVVAALRARGHAVANGGMSTVLTQAWLIASQTLVFSTFFKMMCGIVFVGLAHALIVLPVFLSCWPDDESGRQRPCAVPTDSPDPDAALQRGQGLAVAEVIGAIRREGDEATRDSTRLAP